MRDRPPGPDDPDGVDQPEGPDEGEGQGGNDRGDLSGDGDQPDEGDPHSGEAPADFAYWDDLEVAESDDDTLLAAQEKELLRRGAMTRSC